MLRHKYCVLKSTNRLLKTTIVISGYDMPVDLWLSNVSIFLPFNSSSSQMPVADLRNGKSRSNFFHFHAVFRGNLAT